MKLLTLILTTKNPLITPATAHAARAMKIPAIGETLLFLASEVVITKAIAIIAPIDKSYVPVVRGTRNARASTPMITFSDSTSLRVVPVRNVSDRVSPNQVMKAAQRYKALYL